MKNNLKFSDGWIDPYGKFYGCKPAEHSKIGVHHFLLEDRWIKISSYCGGHIFCRHFPTQAQINTFYDWCEVNNDMRMWRIFKEKHLNE